MEGTKVFQKAAFNQTMLERNGKVDGNDYFVSFHQEIRQEVKVSFLNQFLDLCNSTVEFCIHQSRLSEFGVSSDVDSNIKRYIIGKGLKENVHYEVVIRYVRDSIGRNVPKEEFMLSSSGFKKCLMRSQNIDEFCDYFLLLEDIWKNYLDYEKKYNQRILTEKDDHIKILINELKKNNIELKHNNIKLDDISESNKEILKENKKMNRKLDTIHVKVHQISPSVVSTPLNKKKKPEFMLLQSKHDDKMFSVVCGKNEYVTLRETRAKPGYKIILREYNANPDTFYDIIRERIDEYNNTLINVISECNSLLEEYDKNDEELKEMINESNLSFIKYNNKDITIGEECLLEDLLVLIDEARNEPKEILHETFEIDPLKETK